VDDVLDDVWEGLHVTPDLVREYVSDLRAALQDDARDPRHIETIRGKGFRLRGGVTFATPETQPEAFLSQQENRPTVAVLRPTTSGPPEIAAFAEGVASDILNHLARFHYIGVVARHSTFSSREVTDLRAFARDVQADYFLESNFAALGETVRARFQLVDGATARNLWAERYDHRTADLVAASEKIANAVVLAMTGWHGELHRAEYKTVTRKRDTELNAFEHFVLGCDLEMQLDAEGLRRSLWHLEQSVTLDPTFARAWLVYALELRWAYAVIPGRDRTYLERSNAAFAKAFNLAPYDPVTLALMAMKFARDGNIDTALDMLARAEADMARDSDAMVCVATAKSVLTEDIASASAIFETALSANKTPPSWFYFAGAGLFFMAGDYERSVSFSRSGPQEISAMIFRCLSYAILGKSEMARIAHEELIAAFPKTNFAKFADNFPIFSLSRRAEYDAAVARLHEILADSDRVWMLKKA